MRKAFASPLRTFSSASSEIAIKLRKLEIRCSYLLSLQSSVCTSICILNPCKFQTGSQYAESGGRYERYLEDSFSVCQLCALQMKLLTSTHLTTLCWQEQGKGRASQTLHLACEGWPVLSIQRHEHKGEKGVCNHHTCDSASLAFLLAFQGK